MLTIVMTAPGPIPALVFFHPWGMDVLDDDTRVTLYYAVVVMLN